MKKIITFALAAAFSSAAVEAQILKYGAEAGETQPDTVNWYADQWTEPGGYIDFQNKDAATGEYAVNVYNPESAADRRWERVFKFDKLEIKENTNYRVRLSAKAPSEAKIHVALMCGDENCDMPFTFKLADGSRSDQYGILSGWNEGSYTTRSAMFRYTSDAVQNEFYPQVKPDDANPLGLNRFLRVSVLDAGDFYLDDFIVEEAAIAGAYHSMEAIKIDFGFPTNIAALVKENNGAVITLPNECAKVVINGTESALTSVELKDGSLYIFPEEGMDEDSEVKVSFDATKAGINIKYDGELTPGDGIDVPSFTEEASSYDENITATSNAYQEPKLLTSSPADGSFELSEDLNEFSFTFDRDIKLTGASAIKAQIVIDGKAVDLKNISEGEEGPVAKFKLEGKTLTKNSYTIYLFNIESAMGIPFTADDGEIAVTFETGKVSVAGVTYTDVATVNVMGENGNHSENWTSYFDGEEVVPAGSGIRMFDFPAEGKYTKGFYLSQRDAGELGTALTYGEKPEHPLTLPAGNVQLNILTSYWQSNSGSFLYEVLDAEGNLVAEGSGTATTQQADQGTPATAVTATPINLPDCKAGNYVVRLTTKTGGFGNAIIVWGLDIKTYEVSSGETADNQVVVDGSWADVANDGVPAAGTGWHVYQEDILLEAGSVAGQRTRFFTGMGIKNLTNAFYNRNMGSPEHVYRLTYGELTHADESLPCLDADGNPVEEKAFELDVARYNFSWYICNWKGTSNNYYFKIYNEDGEEVYSREDLGVTVNCDGDRNKAVEAQKVEFSWTPKVAGRYTMEWYMTGESMVGNLKVEKMGSLAVFWHTQLNEAIAKAEEERANCAGDEYAGATRDALDKAIQEAKTVTYHTGAEYTAAMERLAQYVKDMAGRREAIGSYTAAYNDLAAQIESMVETKFVGLDSYKSGKEMVEKYAGVEGWTIDTETLLPLVADMQTAKALNDNLMQIGVPAMTDQMTKLVATYNALLEYVPEEQETAGAFDLVLSVEDALSDDQEMVANLKKVVTSQLYKAIANGYNFQGLEFPDEEESEDNPMISKPLDVSGYIRNSVFYAYSPERELHNTEACNAAVPGWQFDAQSGLSLNWGWGGWAAPNAPVAPVNVVEQHLGTKWATDFSVWQDITDIPVGVYSIGCFTADDSNLNNEELEIKTKSTIYVEVDGEEPISIPFNIETSSNYRQESLAEITDVTIKNGTARFGANCDVDGGFAAIDNASLKMSAPLAGFDYAAAAKQIDEELSTAIKNIESGRTDAPMTVQYYDINGRKNMNATGVVVRVETWADGQTRISKVLRRK